VDPGTSSPLRMPRVEGPCSLFSLFSHLCFPLPVVESRAFRVFPHDHYTSSRTSYESHPFRLFLFLFSSLKRLRVNLPSQRRLVNTCTDLIQHHRLSTSSAASDPAQGEWYP